MRGASFCARGVVLLLLRGCGNFSLPSVYVPKDIPSPVDRPCQSGHVLLYVSGCGCGHCRCRGIGIVVVITGAERG